MPAARSSASFAAYGGAGRHYHGLTHLTSLFTVLARFPLRDAAVVALAVWYHDAVYNALRADNEANSAEWALAFFAETNLAPARPARVADLIRRTKDHTQPQPPGNADLLLFRAADLAILDAPAAAYWQYARQAR